MAWPICRPPTSSGSAASRTTCPIRLRRSGEFAALVRPGGVLALREGGLPLRCLPSYADGGLSARMDAIADELAHRHEHPMGAINAPRDWPALLREAGLTGVISRTFLLDLPAPLDDRGREGLQRHLRMSRDMLATAPERRRPGPPGPADQRHRPGERAAPRRRVPAAGATVHTGTQA